MPDVVGDDDDEMARSMVYTLQQAGAQWRDGHDIVKILGMAGLTSGFDGV